MSYEVLVGSDIGVLKATADLSAKQYHFAKGDVANNDQVVIAALGTDQILGVIQNTPALGEAVQLRVVGISKLKLGGTVTRFDRVTSDTAGKGVLATGMQPAAAIAMESGVSGDIIPVLMVSVASGYKVARGQATTVAASDTIVTGLATVASVVAVLDSDPVAGCQFVTASIGDQAGTPAAGSFLLKTWKATATADTAVIAATTFTKKVNWIAVGT